MNISQPDLEWRRSSVCASNMCVEVARTGNTFLIRDSKDYRKPPLAFDAAEWAVFVTAIKEGNLEL
ncbi:DUF397 domain-containing protein [Actinoplanes sp. M2I2]|uniref:DUF397 domain-containing protein n=1 Tax=Actinoplanes sp. M2I2 TaxID=1734444 RepID=UPI0024C28286|nr:DUF397 domain-containing protein [Actinoplanes sp. M2I2]